MKIRITDIAAICILLMSFLSCNDDKSSTVGAKVDTETPGVGNKIVVDYNIKNDSALTYISTYQDYVETVKDSLAGLTVSSGNSEKLIYGVRVQINELKQVLENAEQHDSLWVMMAIKPIGEADMIFTMRSTNSEGEETWKFFDFTQPCPTSCPNLPFSQ